MNAASIVGAPLRVQLLHLLGVFGGVGAHHRVHSPSIACLLQQTTHKTFRRSVRTSTIKHPAASVQHTRSVLHSFSPSLCSSVTLIVSPPGNTDSHHCGLYVIYASFPRSVRTISESRTGLCAKNAGGGMETCTVSFCRVDRKWMGMEKFTVSVGGLQSNEVHAQYSG